jgi:hypothetical protein
VVVDEGALLLAGLLDTPGSQAPGAEGHIARGPLHHYAVTRDIEELAALTDVVGVADLAADMRTPSTDLAPPRMCDRHSCPSDAWVGVQRSPRNERYHTASRGQNQEEKDMPASDDQ